MKEVERPLLTRSYFTGGDERGSPGERERLFALLYIIYLRTTACPPDHPGPPPSYGVVGMVVILVQKSVDVGGLVAPRVGNVQVHQLGGDVVVGGAEDVDMVHIEAGGLGVVQEVARGAEVDEGILRVREEVEEGKTVTD